MKEKEVTIYDLALKLNLSPATISRGLKDHPAVYKKTKKKIYDLPAQMGYRSNSFTSNLRRQQTNTIGVIVPRHDSHFMSTVIAGIHLTNQIILHSNLIIRESSVRNLSA